MKLYKKSRIFAEVFGFERLSCLVRFDERMSTVHQYRSLNAKKIETKKMCRKIRQVLRRVEQKVHAAVSEFLKLTALERKDSEVYFRRLFANGTHDWRKNADDGIVGSADGDGGREFCRREGFLIFQPLHLVKEFTHHRQHHRGGVGRR